MNKKEEGFWELLSKKTKLPIWLLAIISFALLFEFISLGDAYYNFPKETSLEIKIATSNGLSGIITRKIHGEYTCSDFKNQNEAQVFLEKTGYSTSKSGNSIDGYEYDSQYVGNNKLDPEGEGEVCGNYNYAK